MNFALPYIYYYFSVFLGIFSSQTGRDLKKITARKAWFSLICSICIHFLIYCCYWVLYPRVYAFLTKRTKVIFLVILLMYSLIKIVMFFGTPIGLYENVVTGAMSYGNRKEFMMREVKL